MKCFKYSLLMILAGFLWMCKESSQKEAFTRQNFIDPPIHYWPRPLYFWNNTTVTAEVLTEQMQKMRDQCGYGGFGVVPFGKNFSPGYLSEDYLKLYGTMLEKAKELGMKISLYDEFGFPSGSVGAFTEGDDTPRFQQKYPDMTIQRLDKEEFDITGPVAFSRKIPEGKLMGVVAMDMAEHKRIDLTGHSLNGTVSWNVPAGIWKIMIFTCVLDGYPVADYLYPEANELFTGMVHDVYFERFKEYFGSVIYGTFFDEPSMFHAQFRMWTPQYNEKFSAKFGFSPITLYPSMWYDIGSETQSARNYLFGFRAELYTLGFTRVVNNWSVAHGITATGHTAPEEAIVPANQSGDLMKSFKYLEIPGIDKIGGYRYAERYYKLISSSAYNWDRSLVMSETYGAMPNYQEPGDLKWNEIYSIAMDQYSKGINMLIPHAVWYDNTKVTYKPELSYRNPLYADSLKAFTTFLSRLNVILQPEGRHVADIALLYPIHSLLSEHYFYAETGPANVDGWVDPLNKFYKDKVAQIDYVNVANWLTNAAGRDFTFIHPEVLDEKCLIEGNRLNLQNTISSESYRVIIVPSCALISIGNLSKIEDFYNAGGVVIFTTRLPSKSAEIGKDTVVSGIIRSMFPDGERDAGVIRSNEAGGKACFIPIPDGQKILEVLSNTGLTFDVEYPVNPAIQYIHKIIENRNIYFIANTGGSQIDTDVILRDKVSLEEWDPHTGGIQRLKTESGEYKDSSSYLTKVKLNLKPYHSIFWVEDN